MFYLLLRFYFVDGYKPFRCEKCKRAYMYKSTLLRHKKYECDGIARFSCPVCSKAYTQSSTVRQHIRAAHPSFGPQG